MNRASHVRLRVAALATLTLFFASFAPLVANAQANICVVANTECPATRGGQPCACPITALGIPIATIVGVCSGPSQCTETGIIPTPTTATLLVGGGLGVSALLSSLFSGGSGGSGSTPDSFNGGLATASLAPPDLTFIDTSLPTISSETAAKNARFDALIAGIGKADPAIISVANADTTPSALCNSAQSSVSKEVDALQAALKQTCLQI